MRIMIIGSLLLLLAGACFLVVGLAVGNDAYLIGTIVASLMAAVCLYAGSRQRPVRDQDVSQRRFVMDDDEEHAQATRDARLTNRSAGDNADADRESASRARKSRRQEYLEVEVEVDGVPPDEPAEYPMSSVEAAALMRMDAEVVVVDGRPRFHLGGCVHLTGRSYEPLPAYEAVELGFTACSLCQPVQSLRKEPSKH